MATKIEIQVIIQADDAARDAVLEAQREAARIRADAQWQAEEIAASHKARLAEAVANQVEGVLAEAQSKAQKANTEADDYLGRLHTRKQQLLSDLVSRLTEMVIGQ